MYGQMTSPDVPNQMYQELVHTAEQQSLAHRVARERRAARRLARQERRIQVAAGTVAPTFRMRVQRLVPGHQPG